MINDPYYTQGQNLVQNPNQLQYNAINPNAMSNMQTLQGINGTQLDNTFNRTVGSSLTSTNPVNPVALPTPTATTPTATTQYADPNMPMAAPKNVKTKIMPNNNLQTY